jgi:hypothetical protein
MFLTPEDVSMAALFDAGAIQHLCHVLDAWHDQLGHEDVPPSRPYELGNLAPFFGVELPSDWL